jgi:hypothetical protein
MVWRRALDLRKPLLFPSFLLLFPYLEGVNVCSLAAFLPSFDAVHQDQHCNLFLTLEALNWLGTPN